MYAELEDFYLRQPEPAQGCLFALRHIILNAHPGITEIPKYQIPFFYYKEKMVSFLWMSKKKLMLGFVTDKKIHPIVPGVKRKDEMEMIQIDPAQDLPVEMIRERIKKLVDLYDGSREG